MEKGSFPKPSDEDRAWFTALLPDAPGVRPRKMFGNEAAFVGDHMFMCLLGSRLAVRLRPEHRAQLLEVEGSERFEPMPGRAMAEYVVLPAGWRREPAVAADWVDRACAYARSLPPKPAKPPRRP